MKTRKKLNLAIVVVIALILVNVSCKKTNTADPANNNQPPAVTGVQITANTTFGNILTDNNGFTLYFFAKDVSGTSACAGACNTTWPVFYKQNPSIGTGLNSSDFGVITRSDGAKQTTYKGWPLYYNVNDTKAGDVRGDGTGQLWMVARNDYAVMVANAQLVGSDGQQYNDQGALGQGASQYITDYNGRTLYLYTKDTANKNTFTKPDFSNESAWSIYVELNPIGSIPSILDKTQFGLAVFQGTNSNKSQLTYKNHPLYYFGGDGTTAGSTKGVSNSSWRIANSNTVAL
ncbi:hypothetical protein BEL04_17550 [Mucilaginibacter sp. PPCGB 2223]|uniref:hypothetical protein n=1 Tax=Mucilaginibacter sp. PPCGB 2223 TaxID=1886027 RepID=UPI00082682AA|nr:hypothetical protein [Mucilaginibacter sp. PPCGB 2223]OCX51817.1 hypothetical protein BEL04_17550 [Mucilaginibacter sp. PPCGB 2223]